MPDHGYAPGTLLTDNRKELKIACRDGFILPQQLQLAGRKRMDVVSFLNGTELESGVVLDHIYKD